MPKYVWCPRITRITRSENDVRHKVYYTNIVRFTWDGRKADGNARKHGVTFEGAVTVFSDPLALILEDESHPENARIIGESIVVRILLVVFVERNQDLVRLISARRATRHERRRYEEGV
jgi:uncharacterized DUF497 family protein